ncbi:bile acid-CoA:amino acid N-acyltransferase-like [Ruditapes philippinarum]|uniref:bile acid-CoA:amino acid N-acyltransferase-like n=1 Tax=Ruditapes philippinarum TaxID=129788 RepID=UPI00295ABCE1|nr:bile acid-CoA:amino acid N-acyltransferase-like [Ruditapes philippinarum]
MFLPPGKGPFPCVIDMFGVVGSCVEFRAALLASRGFAAIALPYFLHDDLPVDLRELELEYFMVSTFSFVLFRNRYDKIIVTEEGVDVTETLHCNVEDYVPIWTKDVNVLIISGLDDRCLKPDFLYNLWKRYPSNRKHLCTIYRYPGAGHLIEPPYSPLARSTLGYCPESAIKYLKGFTTDNRTILVLWGGETEAHAHAQEDSWKRILNHFRTTLQTSQKKGDNILDSKL